MATKSTPTPTFSDAEYRKWAKNLVGKDWEIFWQEEEDGNEEADEAKDLETENVDMVTTTATGQENAEEKKTSMDSNTDGILQIEMDVRDVNGQVGDSPPDKATSIEESKDAVEPSKSKQTIELEKKAKDGDNEDDVASVGSVIDDWYDGHVVGIINDTTAPVGKNGWKFRVHFVGDEEAYEVCLVPDKVRPSARGWVQRTIAMLNPPLIAAGQNISEDKESNLPPETSSLDDQQSLLMLKAKITDSSNLQNELTSGMDNENYNSEVASLPKYNDFRRIQTLRFQLESQIYLRGKLSKIVNHSGKELFTKGVRNPTESYVNHLVQCCKDLVQACTWYCNSWKLLIYYFGDTPTAMGAVDVISSRNISTDAKACKTGEEEEYRPTDLGKLNFEGLIKDYLEFGKNTIVNAAMIDINATSSSNKRRHAIGLDSGSSGNRRTKRRRKISKNALSGAEEEFDEKNAKIITAASKLGTEYFSKGHVEIFVKTIAESVQYRHIVTLGHMLQFLSHRVVDPLASWKSQARRILGINNKGNDTYNLMIDKIGASGIDSNGKLSSDVEDEEVNFFFSYEQIEACLSVISENNVLSRFNLVDDVHKLHSKLDDIQKNEAKVLALLNDLSLDTEFQEKYYNRSQDKVLSDLTTILNGADSPDSTLYNVDPLNTKTSSAIITRGELSKAIELRAWFVDVEHAQQVRERNAFLQRLISKIEPVNILPDVKNTPALANIPQLFQKREALVQIIVEVQAKIKNCTDIVEKRENDFLTVSSSVDISNSSDLKSHLLFLHSVLSELKDYPVIFPVEEKVAARIDLIEWYEKVNSVLRSASAEENNKIHFVDLKNSYDDLQSVLQGFSSTRATLINGIESDNETNDEIRKFLSSDLFSNCKETINKVTKLYNSSSLWEKRAESILLCLRAHGNSNAGDAIISQKLPAMVDIKRIVDLATDYPGLQIEISEYFEQLQRIQSEAYQWSQNLYTTLMDEHKSFADALSFIQRERHQRPKGIIIYPTRTVADSTVDFLVWFEKIKDATKVVSDNLKQLLDKEDPREVAALYSKMIISEFYPILADGSEALDIYCSTYKTSDERSDQFKLSSDQRLGILEKYFRIRKSSRAPTREKIISNDLVSSLFSRISSQEDREGFSLQLIFWFQWHLLVAGFISQYQNEEDSGIHPDQVRSLVQAKHIKAQNPFLSIDVDLSDAPNIQILVQTKSIELLELDRIIEEAQNVETNIKKGLAATKELLRGSLFDKAELVREHLSRLKTLISMLKARSLGKNDLSINGVFENPLEQHIKYFSWIVRTLQYPVLHQGEASYSSSITEDSTESKRIPWNALFSIHERMPGEVSEFGDPILCILRVKELYAAAKKWQDEVSRTTLISNRGNKRRGTKQSKLENAVQVETKEEAKRRMRKMEMLGEDRILSKVDMPRHKAVQAMVDAKKEFETQLENFLAQDFDGNQDNAPLPKGDSLVGQNGQFILYRLTGSALFSMMQTSVQSLAAIGDNVFAETRGKATFDWMRSTVKWIEELQHAVITQSKFTSANEKLLVIPTKDAKHLCKSGERIFLKANKNVTQTLSNHGIYVSVNSIKKRLNVRLKKDGAHHSVGGIIIRWCPILFDAIRADVKKLQAWETRLKKIVDNFNAFVTRSSQSNAIVDKDNLYQWYCYYVEVQTALEEGENSLVVFPAKDAIDSFTQLLGTIRKYLEEKCSRELIEEFWKRLFVNSASLYEDRFDLLDALLYRRESARRIEDGMEETPFSALETQPTFRDICRSNFEKSLFRATFVFNLESAGFVGVEDLCALKAWEIELEIFETFRDEITDIVPEGYRVKAESLKNNLENKSNISLCLKLLTDDIKVDALVKMTADELASRNLKLEREKAKKAELTNIVLTQDAKPLKSILKKKKTPLELQKDISPSPEAGVQEKLKFGVSDDYTDVNLDANADGAPTVNNEEDDLFISHSNPSSTATNNRIETLPPPPPSLAIAFDTSEEDDRSSSVDSGLRVANMFGGESFQIELQGQINYTFSAAFYKEDESQATVDQFLSESLVQKGRSKIEDFDRFLSEKLRGDKWQATCLRLATIGDRDANIYRAFYKDFEAKERIAMFKLQGESGGKLFLVTPKFHHIARRTRDIAFGNKNTTYAIVLTKKDDDILWA